MSEKVKWPFPNSPYPLWWKISSSITIAAVGTLSKFWLCCMNSTKIYRKEVLCKAVQTRPKRVPLITVTNHHSCMDDPLLPAIVPLKTFLSPSTARWTPAAEDICFTNRWHGIFFALGQNIPVVRGGGVYQRGVDYTIKQLNRGAWAHVFPEGRINLEKKWIRLKWGVGRLISECQHVPIVVPFYHLGTDDVFPNTKPYIPKWGGKVTVLIGDPIDFEPFLITSKRLGLSSLLIRKCITDVIQEELEKLRIESTKLHLSR